jgi:hypothetical protein
MDIKRDLRCTFVERLPDQRITKFALMNGDHSDQEAAFLNFVLRPGERMDRDAAYEIVIRRKGPPAGNGT